MKVVSVADVIGWFWMLKIPFPLFVLKTVAKTLTLVDCSVQTALPSVTGELENAGTVAAATEGFLFGVPAIAFSQLDKGWAHLDAAVKYACDLVKFGFPELPRPYLLNVNIPNLPLHAIKGIRKSRLGKRHASEPVIPMLDPHGRQIFWIGPPGGVRDGGDGTDFDVTSKFYVSVTPLQVDLTNYKHLDMLDMKIE